MKILNRAFDSDRAYRLVKIIVNSLTIISMILLVINVFTLATDQPTKVYNKCYDICDSTFLKSIPSNAKPENWQQEGWGWCSSHCMESYKKFEDNNSRNIQVFGLMSIGFPTIFYGGSWLLNYLFPQKKTIKINKQLVR